MDRKPDNPSAAPAVEAVVFDLGNVVIEVDMRRCGRRWAEAIGRDFDEVEPLFWADRNYMEFERGEIDLAEYHRLMTRRLGGAMTLEVFRDGWNDVFLGLSEGALDLLDALAPQVRLIALTNTNVEHTETWMSLYPDLVARFEKVFCSHDIGSRKPEPEAFQPVIDYLRLPPPKIAFADDRPDNVEAAEAMGMRGIVTRGVATAREALRAMGLKV